MAQALSLNSDLIDNIFRYAKPLGHHQESRNLNLGFGFLYYGLVRALRPMHVLVIGSGFGFSVVCLALGIKDNEEGRLSFVDPSYSLLRNGPFKTVGGIGKWDNPVRVREHFEQFGVAEIVHHYKQTSEEFFPSYRVSKLPPIDVAFVDGNHSLTSVRHDFLEVFAHCRKNSYIFLHDTHLPIRELVHHSGVNRWLKILKKEPELFEIINFPFDSGVALIRVKARRPWKCECR
ncbi:MAG: hypothetical protein AUK55_06525 [Syntrophobacteraceae bacterium CG2_30_61_12]|nr:MAG: hypothetical protein AUK55_06525 [Syntrophobacteraceae bacterium CG2_30_61_12]